MKFLIVAMGQRLPAWAEAACQDYLGRFGDWQVEMRALSAQAREGKPVAAVMQAEAKRLNAAIGTQCRRVILDERGKSYTSAALAARVQAWREDGRDVALVIGGADGLDPDFKANADEALRLSDMTLPHALARVILVEQLYRAWSLLNNHPYHRA